MFDEATSGLDPPAAEDILQSLIEYSMAQRAWHRRDF